MPNGRWMAACWPARARFTGDVDIGAAGTMTFDQIANAGYGGTLSGSGRLLKTDAGLVELSGHSGDFAGTTTVAAGTLRVTNTLGGTVAVEDGASLGGSGIGEFTGAVTIADGGTLLGRQGETLTMGSLALSNGANVNVALGAPAPGAVRRHRQPDARRHPQCPGPRRLWARPLPAFRLWRCADRQRHGRRSTPAGISASALSIQTAIDNEINLLSTAGVTLNFWDGPSGPNNGVIDGGDGVWNTANHNWTDANGAVNAPWGNGQFVIFQGNAGTVTVETDAGISVTGMQFAVDGYTVTGSAIALQNQETVIRVGTGARSGETMTATIDSVLYGTSALVKHDYGTLILSQANLYSGGTFVRGGVLQVADDRSLGADTGGLVIDNATLRTTADMASARAVELAGTHGTIETDGGTSLTLSGPVFGAGSLVKEGAGRLELNGTSSYAGNTFVRAGTLVGDAGSIRGALVNDGETVFDQAVTGTFAGTVQGGGLAMKEAAGQLILSGDSIARWQVDAGTLTSAAERFTGDVAIGDAGTLNFEQIADAGYGGNLTGSGALLKTGGGLLELSADLGDFAGATTIAGGTLPADQQARRDGRQSTMAHRLAAPARSARSASPMAARFWASRARP